MCAWILGMVSTHVDLGGGFKYFLFSPRKIGEDEPILTSIFFKMGWFNHQPGTLFFRSLPWHGFFKAQAILAGAVSDWNKENPTKAVQPGDRVHGDPGMKMGFEKGNLSHQKKGGPPGWLFRIDISRDDKQHELCGDLYLNIFFHSGSRF